MEQNFQAVEQAELLAIAFAILIAVLFLQPVLRPPVTEILPAWIRSILPSGLS